MDDTKCIIRSRISKDKPCNDQQNNDKMTNHGRSNTAQKTKHLATRIPLKQGSELMCSTSDICRVTVKRHQQYLA
jgi:hypothetical protein